MRNDRERRFVTTDFEFRSVGNRAVFEGYALKWNTRSQNLGGFYEIVAPGATTKTIQEADVRALFNHDPNLVLGRNKSGTLRLSEDGTGLLYHVDMPDTTYARDLAVSMERGDVSQSSFGFRTIDDEWSVDENNDVVRTLREIALFDVSPVTYPAYNDSTSGLATRAAFSRVAEKRGVPLYVVKADLKAAVAGDIRAADSDDDPKKIAAAVDAAIDEALEILYGESPDGDSVAQATALVQAADLAVDHLLTILGVPDPDDTDADEAGERSAMPGIVEIPVLDFAKRGLFLPRN